jgi:deazaflavin-dependent oxidoreductase (nitroreductase family)
MGAAPHGYEDPMTNSYQDFNRDLIKDLRANRGKATSGPFQGRDVLILTTKGAKSGEARENPLAFTRDGENIVVVGSKGGAPTHPSWYHNLLTHPEVTVEVEGEKFNARAHVPKGEEYERLYTQHADVMPGFYEYRKKTTRQIPVIVLERLNSR